MLETFKMLCIKSQDSLISHQSKYVNIKSQDSPISLQSKNINIQFQDSLISLYSNTQSLTSVTIEQILQNQHALSTNKYHKSEYQSIKIQSEHILKSQQRNVIPVYITKQSQIIHTVEISIQYQHATHSDIPVNPPTLGGQLPRFGSITHSKKFSHVGDTNLSLPQISPPNLSLCRNIAQIMF